MASAAVESRGVAVDSALNTFLLVLPDGSVRLYERPRMTAADVISEFPHHSVSLVTPQPRQLTPDTELLSRDTHYLHPPPGSPACSQESANTNDADASGTSSVSGLQNEHSLSTEAPSGADQPRGAAVEDPSQKHSSFPGPSPFPPISQQFTRQQSQPRSYLPPDLRLLPDSGHRAPSPVQEEWHSIPTHPKTQGMAAGRRPQSYRMSREEYRATLASKPMSSDDSDFPLFLGYACEHRQPNAFSRQLPRAPMPPAPVHQSQTPTRLPPPHSNQALADEKRKPQSMRVSREEWRARLASYAGSNDDDDDCPLILGDTGMSQRYPPGYNLPSLAPAQMQQGSSQLPLLAEMLGPVAREPRKAQSMRMPHEQYRAMLAGIAGPGGFEAPLILGEDIRAWQMPRAQCELQSMNTPEQFAREFSRLPTLPTAALADGALGARAARGGTGQGLHQQAERPTTSTPGRSREDMLRDLRAPFREMGAPAGMQRASSFTHASSTGPGPGGVQQTMTRRTNSVVGLGDLKVKDSQLGPAQWNLMQPTSTAAAAALTLPLQAPTSGEISLQKHIQQQQHKDEAVKGSKSSRGGSLLSRLTSKFSRAKGARGSKSLDMDHHGLPAAPK